MPIKHLIFDCDGVIVDSEIVATRIAIDFLNQYGYENDEVSHCKRFSGMLGSEILDIIFDELGKEQPAGLMPELDAAFEASFAEILEPIPGMPELMKAATLPISIVSNSLVRHVNSSLGKANLSNISEGRIYSSEHVPNPKPAPDVYELAIRETGLPKDQLIVVEDSAAGVTAAKAAGLTVIGFLGASHIFEGHDEKLRKIGVDYLAKDASELSILFAQLL